MTTGLSYDGSVSGTTNFVSQIATLSVVPPTEPNFLSALPQAIAYAENRIYRELDFLSTVTALTTSPSTSAAYTLTAGARQLSIPAADFVTLQEINVITPANTLVANDGVRNPLLPVTKEFLAAVYPANNNASVPQYFALLDQSTIIVGPWSDNNYLVEVVGTVRPRSLGPGTNNTTNTTFISLYLPDLMIMATMIYISGYQRNFGRQSDDPQMAQSYESQYQALLKGAMVEEARKKFQAGGWTSMTPAVIASPSRG
jgi:hypothetical protein